MRSHRINCAEIELVVSDRAVGEGLFTRVSYLRERRIAPLIDRLCSEESGPERVDRIERLELDLGTIALETFDDDFVRELEVALRDALRDALPARRAGHTGVESSLQLVEIFAWTGNLPWWASTKEQDPVRSSVDTLVATAPEQWVALVRRLARDHLALARLRRNTDERVWQRLVDSQFGASLGGERPDEQQHAVVEQRAAENPSSMLDLLSREPGDAVRVLASLAGRLRELSVSEPVRAWGSSALEQAPAFEPSTMLEVIAARLRELSASVPAKESASSVHEPTTDQADESIDGEHPMLEQQLAVDPSKRDAATRSVSEQEQLDAEVIATVLQELGVSGPPRPSTMLELLSREPGDALRALASLARRLALAPGIARASETDAPPMIEHNLDLENLDLEVIALLRELASIEQPRSKAATPASPDEPIADEADAHADRVVDAIEVDLGRVGEPRPTQPQPDQRRFNHPPPGAPSDATRGLSDTPLGSAQAARRHAIEQLDELYVEDAGLVILWPFLSRFFARVGLLDEDQRFLDEPSRMQAIALLEFLVNEEPEPPEFCLPLAKLLCGLAPVDEYVLERPLDPEHLAECEHLLASVIDNAPILRAMPVATFRSTFLQRSAALRTRDGAWLLQVERGDYDLVLAHFPWSWTWVKLPWMPDPMRVEW